MVLIMLVIDAADEKELLFLAHKISSTSAAPNDWTPSKPLGLFKPPHPQEDAMRASLLYRKFFRGR